MLRGKHIVIGVTGGIAAYKAVYLVRELQQTGAEVRVTMTESATRFVGRETFASLTRHDVPVRIFPDSPGGISENWTQHIQWAEWADLIVVAPCTANSLATIVYGFSDSMLTATILAARCPVLLCPTMDGEMYRASATRTNLDKARDLGFHLLPPDHGYLASGLDGPGRLPEPAVIMEQIQQLLSEQVSQPDRSDQQNYLPLNGKNVLVTCGPTREFLDPVRFLSNPSTGKMGMAMAEAALALGAEITLLHAASIDTSRLPESIHKHPFVSTEDLFKLVKSHCESDIIIMTAAVSDFRPAKTHTHKVKKESAELQIPLERTPDILLWLGDNRSNEQVIIGFAMETEHLAKRVRNKRAIKKADWMVGNDLSGSDSGFAVDTNRVLVVGSDSEVRFEGAKSDVARSVLRYIFAS